MRFILASKSPRRSELLKIAGFDFDVVVSDAEEKTDGAYKPEIPFINAIDKAKSVSLINQSSIVLGADTVVEFEDQILGKPSDLDDARKMLLKLSGHAHFVTTGVCLECIDKKISCVFGETTKVRFKQFGEKTVSEYLEKVYTLDKAGAYAIQESGEMLVEEIDGSMENVIGLPVKKVVESVYAFGFGNLITKRAPSENLMS
jgi:septum formation protein